MKNRYYLKTALLACVWLYFTASTITFGQNQQIIDQIFAMDTNGDGFISEAESTGVLKRSFSRTDLNNDGQISRQEIQALAERLKKMTSRLTNAPAPLTQRPKKLPAGVAWEGNLNYREGNPRWTLDIAYPTTMSRKNELRPGIIFIHGGGWAAGSKSFGAFKTLPIEYAAKGYVCISVNYRLIGEAPFPACLEDVKCAVRWMRANAEKYFIDPNRIGAYGESAGAHLVSMLGLVGKEAGLEGDGPYQNHSSQVQAVCATAAPTDLTQMYVFGLLPGPPETKLEREKRASPISYVNAKAPPFLLFHGTRDRLVNYEINGKAFADALKNAGAKDVKLMTFENAGHGVFYERSRETKPAMEKFFDRVLKRQ